MATLLFVFACLISSRSEYTATVSAFSPRPTPREIHPRSSCGQPQRRPLANKHNPSLVAPIIRTPPSLSPLEMSSGASAAAAAVVVAASEPVGGAVKIDGKAIAATIRAEIKDAVSELQTSGRALPGLAVILVGSRRDSQTYVRMKEKACVECGISSSRFDYPDDVDQEVLLEKIAQLNGDGGVHGILIQLPLPPSIDEAAVLRAVEPSKDVDGLHPRNTAALFSTSTHAGAIKPDWTDMPTVPFHIPCTPQGCIELLDRSGVTIEGRNAVVVGRSNLVGMPVSMLLLHRNATVTIVHSRTVDAAAVVGRADIVIAAVGRARMVKGSWLKPGCAVIDVGINSVDDPTAKRGYRLVGDVDYDAAKQVAGMITPVPGGVGPMTIAMLMRNTLNSCERSSS